MLICCSSDCEKCKQCGRYIYNLSDKYKNQINTVEPLASFGWGSISMNAQGETHCETHTDCGFNGKYALFEPIESSVVSEGLSPSNKRIIDELEEEIDMLVKEQKDDRSYEIEQSRKEGAREALQRLGAIYEHFDDEHKTSIYFLRENLKELAKECGVEVE